jgi:hypothetical protein
VYQVTFVAEYSESEVRQMLVHNAEPMVPMPDAEVKAGPLQPDKAGPQSSSSRLSPSDAAAAARQCRSAPSVVVAPSVRSAKVARCPSTDMDPDKRFGNRITVYWPRDKRSFHGTVTKVRTTGLAPLSFVICRSSSILASRDVTHRHNCR